MDSTEIRILQGGEEPVLSRWDQSSWWSLLKHRTLPDLCQRERGQQTESKTERVGIPHADLGFTEGKKL